MKLNAYKTEIKNFYIVVSHGHDGKAMTTYILCNKRNDTLVEIIPGLGPITVLKHDSVLKAYLNCEISDRGSWTQLGYDDNDINTLLSAGNFGAIVDILKGFF